MGQSYRCLEQSVQPRAQDQTRSNLGARWSQRSSVCSVQTESRQVFRGGLGGWEETREGLAVEGEEKAGNPGGSTVGESKEARLSGPKGAAGGGLGGTTGDCVQGSSSMVTTVAGTQDRAPGSLSGLCGLCLLGKGQRHL